MAISHEKRDSRGRLKKERKKGAGGTMPVRARAGRGKADAYN